MVGAEELLTLADVVETLREMGIDPERREIVAALESLPHIPAGGVRPGELMAQLDSTHVVAKALSQDMAVGHWETFVEAVVDTFRATREAVPSDAGRTADYIPVLAKVDAELFGVAITTVDGQQLVYGDVYEPVSIQSAIRPLLYALACDENGTRAVHKHVGFAPSGLSFNEVTLNEGHLPHNPFVNSGGIATAATFAPLMNNSQRYKHLIGRLRELAGGVGNGFSQATYLSEKATAFRNQALVHYMSEFGTVFTHSVLSASEALDFYFQTCSLETSPQQLANIAAMMANGGVSPITGETVIDPGVVQTTLTLMFSCGMYDYSGTWCMTVGLPAKSSVSGLIYVVVPNKMGIAIFAPPLDPRGNSIRGIDFARRLTARFQLSIFDQLLLNSRPYRLGQAIEYQTLGAVTPQRFGPSGDLEETVCTMEYRPGSAIDEGHRVARLLYVTRRCLRRFGRLYHVFKRLFFLPGNDRDDAVKASLLIEILERDCISMSIPSVAKMLRDVTDVDGYVSFASVLVGQRTELNFIFKSLLGELAVARFRNVKNAITSRLSDLDRCIVNTDLQLRVVLEDVLRSLRVLHESDAHAAAAPKGSIRPTHLRPANSVELGLDQMAISICTVDGQQFQYGRTKDSFPLRSIAHVLLYAIAMDERGCDYVHSRVGTEPVSMPRDTFKLLRHVDGHVLPYNPFLDTGALALSSMIGDSDPGSSFEVIAKHVSRFAGGRQTAFDQEAYLAFSKAQVRVKALSQFCKGFGILGDEEPDSVSDIFFQTQALDMDCESLSVIAATIANCGLNPTTGVQAFSLEAARNVLSTMYSCGMNEMDGWWNFHVGIPAKGDPAGTLFLIVPNVLGMVIRAPNPAQSSGLKSTWPVSVLGSLLARHLSHTYHWHLFSNEQQKEDESESDDEDVASELGPHLFRLCTFIQERRLNRAKALLAEHGASLARVADYDDRTALHVAASENILSAVKLLVAAGAEIQCRDRWGNTPMDDARTNNNNEILAVLQAALQEGKESVDVDDSMLNDDDVEFQTASFDDKAKMYGIPEDPSEDEFAARSSAGEQDSAASRFHPRPDPAGHMKSPTPPPPDFKTPSPAPGQSSDVEVPTLVPVEAEPVNVEPVRAVESAPKPVPTAAAKFRSPTPPTGSKVQSPSPTARFRGQTPPMAVKPAAASSSSGAGPSKTSVRTATPPRSKTPPPFSSLHVPTPPQRKLPPNRSNPN